MPKISSPDRFKVPAFQRKRSLAAKARRVRKPATAFERREAGVPVVKPKRVCVRRRGEVSESFSSPLVDDYEAVPDYGSDEYEPSYNHERYGVAGVSRARVAGAENLRAEEENLRASRAVIEMRRCGVVEDFFDKISVVAVRVTSSIRIGDRLVFETEDGLFEQVVDSMQINREDVVTAYNGDDLGIKVFARPKKNGSVYKVV